MCRFVRFSKIVLVKPPEKPVLVTGVPVNESASKVWKTEYLLENYGSFSVGVGSSRTITKMGGTGRANARLGDVVEALRTNLDHGVLATATTARRATTS